MFAWLHEAYPLQPTAPMRFLVLPLLVLAACSLDPVEGDPDLETEDEPIDTSQLEARPPAQARQAHVRGGKRDPQSHQPERRVHGALPSDAGRAAAFYSLGP